MKEFPVRIDGIQLDPDAVAKHRGSIMKLGGMFGGEYFTLHVIETHPDFDKAQLEHQKSNSLDFMLNRTPRRFQIRGHEVVAQALVTSPDGTTKVVFNPGTGEEANAALIDGTTGFGETTNEAITNALAGQKVIFANASNIEAKANEYNQNEVDRLNKFIRDLTAQRDSIISTMRRNEEVAKRYEQEVLASKPKATVTSNPGAPTIVIESASNAE